MDKYKSVQCTSDPGANNLKATVTSGSQPSGYCTNNSPDLQAFQSNPDLCRGTPGVIGQGSGHGSGSYGGASRSNVCALAQWTIRGAGHYTWNKVADVDFVHYVSYLDGVELQRGLRYESSTFEVNNTATGARTVSLYYYEDCCSGTAPAYRGWDVVFAPTPTGSDLL